MEGGWANECGRARWACKSPGQQRDAQANGRPGPEHRRVGQPGGVMGMPGQGMATAGAPVKERDQKGPTVANGAGKGGAESTGAMAGFNSLGGLAQA